MQNGSLLITDLVFFDTTFQRGQRDTEFPGDRRLVASVALHGFDNHLPLHLLEMGAGVSPARFGDRHGFNRDR